MPCWATFSLPTGQVPSAGSSARDDCSTNSKPRSCSTFGLRIAELEASGNPFALIVLAHLYTKETKHDQPTRRSFKLQLVRLLIGRQYERPRIRQVFEIIDWLMRLEPEQAIIFKQEMEALQEDETMSAYVNTFQMVGRLEGAHLEAERVLSRLLARRFGDLPAWAAEKLAAASTETLERWSVQLLDAGRIEEVFV